MKLGVCTGFDNFAAAAELGFDYVECSLSALAALSDEEYGALLQQSSGWKIPLYSCNGMMPGSVPCTGPDASDDAMKAYLDRAFSRAGRLGVKTVVFGSSASRSVPGGWPHAEAWRQIAHFLMLAGEAGERWGITVAIEPLRYAECNIINYVSEATALAALVNHPAVGVLGDTFHMNTNAEPYSQLTYAGKLLRHIHIGHYPGRTYPRADDGEDYAALFDTLKAAGYEGGVSIEAGTSDFRADGAAALACLRPLL